MPGKRKIRDILKRCEGNPILTLEDVPFRCADIWNAGVTLYNDLYLMLVTIEELEGTYRIYKALSKDGRNFHFDGLKPVLGQIRGDGAERYESFGVRDPRITNIDGVYYISYVAESRHGHLVGLSGTRDFSHFNTLPNPSQVDVKSGSLFPKKIKDRYCLLKRPNQGSSIWICYSEDLSFWGDHRCIMTPRGGFWDADRIGPAGTPREIEKGWLLLYYGVKSTSAGPLVRLGAAILDREEPWKVIGRSSIPILAPRERYERLGDVQNVVFSCGDVIENGTINVYYGASDSCICLASATVTEIADICLNGWEAFK